MIGALTLRAQTTVLNGVVQSWEKLVKVQPQETSPQVTEQPVQVLPSQLRSVQSPQLLLVQEAGQLTEHASVQPQLSVQAPQESSHTTMLSPQSPPPLSNGPISQTMLPKSKSQSSSGFGRWGV
jgi:hypothetical protein